MTARARNDRQYKMVFECDYLPNSLFLLSGSHIVRYCKEKMSIGSFATWKQGMECNTCLHMTFNWIGIISNMAILCRAAATKVVVL